MSTFVFITILVALLFISIDSAEDEQRILAAGDDKGKSYDGTVGGPNLKVPSDGTIFDGELCSEVESPVQCSVTRNKEGGSDLLTTINGFYMCRASRKMTKFTTVCAYEHRLPKLQLTGATCGWCGIDSGTPEPVSYTHLTLPTIA